VTAVAAEATPAFLDQAIRLALLAVAGLCVLSAYRVVAGPTIPDRVVGVDAIATNVVAIAVLVALLTGRGLFITVGLVLAIIGFIATVTVAKFVIEGDIIE
jgi:multicomponent Na+:H+ antiporter subunit F